MPELSKAERAALDRIAELDEPGRLRNLIVNARRQGSDAVERAAFERLCHVQPEANPGTVEHEVWQAVHALEEMLTEERGRTARLTRTRQKIGKDGEAKTVSDLTLKKTASDGFAALVERGHPELSFEAVVLRHPKTFDTAIQDAARARLTSVGVDPDNLALGAQGG